MSARCSCGQSYVLQCKSFKLLCVIPDPFLSFKHKPGTTWKYFPGKRKPFTITQFGSNVFRFPFFLFSFECFIFLCIYPGIIIKIKNKKSKARACFACQWSGSLNIKADSSVIWSRMRGEANQYIFMVERGREKLISRSLLVVYLSYR